MSMDNIIEVKNVSKSFGGVKANIDISLTPPNDFETFLTSIILSILMNSLSFLVHSRIYQQ
jgi:hypothetical protein